MNPHQGVRPLSGIANNHYAVNSHRRRQGGERFLCFLRAQFFRDLFDLGQLGIAHTRIPLHLVVLVSKLQRQRNGAENADRPAAVFGVGSNRFSIAVNTNELAGLDQPLAYGRVNVSEHGAALCTKTLADRRVINYTY